MVSGNFLICRGISFEGFNRYVQPLFDLVEYSVQDRLVVEYNSNESLLLSVVGEGDLEKGINNLLVRAGKCIEETRIEMQQLDQTPIAWQHQVSMLDHRGKKEGVAVYVGLYETIGVYQADDTATQLFPLIAQQFLLDNVQNKARDVTKTVKSMLGKKLSEL